MAGHRRTILDVSENWPEFVIPDGMTIDKDGLLWVALMFEGCVSCMLIILCCNFFCKHNAIRYSILLDR